MRTSALVRRLRLDSGLQARTILEMSDITLNGGEITILKTLGLSGGLVAGKQLIEKMDSMEGAELLDAMMGLMNEGYVAREQGERPHDRGAGDGFVSREPDLLERAARRGLSFAAREAGRGPAAAARLNLHG